MARKAKKIVEVSDVSIEGLSHDLRGIGEHNGKKVFVFGALTDETISYRKLKGYKNYDEAKALTIDNPSPIRATPNCSHYDSCGGCNSQHILHSAQLTLKHDTLIDLMAHQGLSANNVLPPMSSKAWAYRKKARMSVKYRLKHDDILIGFRERDYSRFVTHVNACETLDPKFGALVEPLRQCIDGLSIKKKIPQVELAAGDEVFCLIIRHLEAFTESDLKQLSQFSHTHDVAIYTQAKGLDSITKQFPNDGQDLVHYHNKHFDVTLYFHPSDFTQVNADINEKMIAQVAALLKLDACHHVLDLFCGIGNFSIPISTIVARVTGVELSMTMVERARYNAKMNHRDNCEFFCANLFEENKQAFARKSYDALIIDPPRSGAAYICDNIHQFNAAAIGYVSCNPATLARDAATLKAKGYTLETVQALDMFPQTSHLEAIAIFLRS